jgi:hypothetical protein
MTFPTHQNTSQFVSDGSRRVVRIVRCLCAVLVLQLSTGFAAAQQNVAKPDQQVQREPRDLLKDEITASQNQTAEKASQSSMEGGLPETAKMLQAREEYDIFSWKNRQDAFAWQSVSTKVIFWVVIIVVLAGLYLSWMQFNFAQNAPMKVTKPSTEGPGNAGTPGNRADATNTTIEVNTSGVKITSSVIGLVILTLSIVFFFLYLKFVYPIIET